MIVDYLKKVFTPYKPEFKEGEPVTLRKDYRVFNQGGAWGNNIVIQHQLRNDDGLLYGYKVYGHSHITPQENDVFLCKMQSGRISVFYFTEVKRETDPPDMFYAQTLCLGYLDEMELDTKGVKAI